MTQAAQPLRKFQFLQEIASGGFGSVYLAKLITPDGVSRVVAVKLLHRRWSDNVEVSSRMRDEARLLSRLRHDNIVEVLDFAVIDGRSAVVMECLEAVDTRVILDACREAGTRMPIAAVFGICGAVASALDAAYNRPPSPGARPMRVIHRDIKPSNVMVDADGRVKVLDFGVARAEFDAREAKTAELAFGSLEYMPPERLFFEPESAASDVYSLGTAIFELLALDKLGKAKLRQSEQEKFLAERLADLTESYPLTPEADADVIDLLKRMLAFDESQRPTAAQVAELAATVSARCVAGGLPGLADWAATALPPLIDLSRTKRAGPGTLIGETILEDPPEAVAMMPRPSVLLGPDDDGDGAEDETAMHTDLLGADEPLEAEIDATVRDDTRWMELKSATLASLGETAEVDASVLQEVQLRVGRARNRPEDLDSEASRNPLQWLEDDDDEFEGAPTVRMHSSEAMGDQELRSPTVFVRRSASEAETVVAPAASFTPAGAPAGTPIPAQRASRPPTGESPIERSGPGSPARTGGATPTPSATPGPAAGRTSGDRRVSVDRRTGRTSPAPVPRLEVDPPPSSGGLPMVYVAAAAAMLVASVVVLLSVVLVGGVGVAALSLPVAELPPVAAAPPAQAGTTDGAPVPVSVAAAAAPAAMPAPAPVAPPGSVAPSEVAVAPAVAASSPGGAGPAAAPPPVEPDVHGAKFVSALPGTRRMMVRCGDASGVGVADVVLAGDGFTECTITAVDGARHRRTAVVAGVEARNYRCFDGDEQSCR